MGVGTVVAVRIVPEFEEELDVGPCFFEDGLAEVCFRDPGDGIFAFGEIGALLLESGEREVVLDAECELRVVRYD